MNATRETDLHPLLDQFTGEGTVLTCYAAVGVTEGFRHDWEGPLRAKADAIWKAIGDSRARREFEENLTAIRHAVESPTYDKTRWIAVFSAAQRGFFLALPLNVPVETDLVVDRSPYLVPLLAAMLRRREYLVVHANTHRGRVYAATPGAVRLLAELDEEVPRKQHSVGQTWSYGQATIARHRENQILHYRKELVRELEQTWNAGGYAGLVLLGTHEVLEQVRKALPQRLAVRVLREAPEPWYETPGQIEGKVRSTATDLFAKQEAEVAPEFWELLRGGKVVAGPRAVIDAIQSGRFGANGHGYLVFGPDPRELAGRCVACRTLVDDPLGTCPRCQAPCAPGNLWEELLLTALRHRIAARFVADSRKLEPHRVVAVLPTGNGKAK